MVSSQAMLVIIIVFPVAFRLLSTTSSLFAITPHPRYYPVFLSNARQICCEYLHELHVTCLEDVKLCSQLDSLHQQMPTASKPLCSGQSFALSRAHGKALIDREESWEADFLFVPNKKDAFFVDGCLGNSCSNSQIAGVFVFVFAFPLYLWSVPENFVVFQITQILSKFFQIYSVILGKK